MSSSNKGTNRYFISHDTISPDRPITSKEEDLLNRAPFAKAVASVIQQWKKRDSLIIALYGQWGSGKSSLKNLIVGSLQKESEGGPYVIEFNPWQCSNNE